MIPLIPYPWFSVAYAADITTEIKSKLNLQGIFYDTTHHLFTLEQDYKNDLSMIFLNHNNHRKLLLKDMEIGHQGFGISTVSVNSTVCILTGMRKSGLNILIYNINDNLDVTKYTVKVFPDNFTQKNETMPALSSDGRFIIARGRDENGKMFIRIFDFAKIHNALNKNKIIDISKDYLYQWPLSSRKASDAIGTLQPLQAIASNGNEVALLFGNARLTPKVIYFYTLKGRLKSIDTNVISGFNDAMVFSQQNFFEPEGLSYQGDGLKILITYAKGINKRNIIYDYIKTPKIKSHQ